MVINLKVNIKVIIQGMILDFNGKAIKIYVHQLVGMCFIHNDMPELKNYCRSHR